MTIWTLETSCGAASAEMSAQPEMESSDVDKENLNHFPVDRRQGAEVPKVISRQHASKRWPCAQPTTNAMSPPVSQASRSALLVRANSLFPEGKGASKAVPRVGAPAALINELVVNAKDAIDDLWKARSYSRRRVIVFRAQHWCACHQYHTGGSGVRFPMDPALGPCQSDRSDGIGELSGAISEPRTTPARLRLHTC